MNYTLTLNPVIPIKIRLSVNLKILWVFALVLIITLLVLYLFQISYLTARTYQLQSYQEKIAELSETKKILEINSAKLNYLENITSKGEELGLERIDTINYIQVIDAAVAASR